MLNIQSWNGLDWALVGILALSTVRAWMRGLVRALFGLLGFVGGFELASWNFEKAGDWIYSHGWLKSLPTARIVAFLVIAAVVAVAFELVGSGLRRSAHAIGFGSFDRAFGAAFGFFRGLLLGVAVIVAVIAFAPQSTWVEELEIKFLFPRRGSCGILRCAAQSSLARPHRSAAASSKLRCG